MPLPFTHLLTDPNPGSRAMRYLSHHPIHGNKKTNYFAHGLNHSRPYGRPFLPPGLAPAHVWPINAIDWGFIELRPFEDRYKPNKHTRNHPALVDGRVQTCDRVAWPAFLYRLPDNIVKCHRTSTHLSNWTIDSNTEEAILDGCWGCRHYSDKCPMEGQRISRVNQKRRGNIDHFPLPPGPLYPWKGLPGAFQNFLDFIDDDPDLEAGGSSRKRGARRGNGSGGADGTRHGTSGRSWPSGSSDDSRLGRVSVETTENTSSSRLDEAGSTDSGRRRERRDQRSSSIALGTTGTRSSERSRNIGSRETRSSPSGRSSGHRPLPGGSGENRKSGGRSSTQRYTGLMLPPPVTPRPTTINAALAQDNATSTDGSIEPTGLPGDNRGQGEGEQFRPRGGAASRPVCSGEGDGDDESMTRRPPSSWSKRKRVESPPPD